MRFNLFPVIGLDKEIANAVEWYEFKQGGLGLKFIEDWESSDKYILFKSLFLSNKTSLLPICIFKKVSLRNYL